MAPSRRIFFSPECDAAAEALGGYSRIDRSLDAVWDGLERNPYGFPKIESDWFSIRYVITKPIDDLPALVWYFSIQGGDITIENVEEHNKY